PPRSSPHPTERLRAGRSRDRIQDRPQPLGILNLAELGHQPQALGPEPQLQAGLDAREQALLPPLLPPLLPALLQTFLSPLLHAPLTGPPPAPLVPLGR